MITSATRIVRYTGNSVATVFAIPFVFHSYGHITVVQTVDGEDTVLTQDDDYTITGVSNPSGGSITISPAPDNTKTLTILRFVPTEQLTDYINNDAFNAEAHERQMDLIVMMLQQLGDPTLVTGSYPLKFPLSEPASHTTVLPNAASRKGHVIFFNEETGELETKTMSDVIIMVSGPTTPAAEAGSDGDVFLNTTTGQIFLHQEGDWVLVAGSGLPEGNAGDMAYHDGDNWVVLAAPAAPGANQRNMLVHNGTAPSWSLVDELTLDYCDNGTPANGTFIKI